MAVAEAGAGEVGRPRRAGPDAVGGRGRGGGGGRARGGGAGGGAGGRRGRGRARPRCGRCSGSSSGPGPLESLLRDPATSDVLVTAPDAVWVDRGAGLERAAVTFADEDAVRRLAQRLAAAAGRRLDDASPYVDARLPGSGVRLHAVLPPVAADGTCVSLRVLRPARHDLDALEAGGTVDATGRALLEAVVAARLAFLVVGGTGSGKTTVLSALLARRPGARADRRGRGRRGAAAAPPARGPAGGAPGQRRGRGHGAAARSRPPGAADAPRPARGRRGPRRRGLRAARSAQHRARRRRGHGPRQLPARGARASRGPGGSRRDEPRGAAQPGRGRDPGGPARPPPLATVGGCSRASGWCGAADAEGLVVVPAWGRDGGWAAGRADLGAMFAERGVAAPWPGRQWGSARGHRSHVGGCVRGAVGGCVRRPVAGPAGRPVGGPARRVGDGPARRVVAGAARVARRGRVAASGGVGVSTASFGAPLVLVAGATWPGHRRCPGRLRALLRCPAGPARRRPGVPVVVPDRAGLLVAALLAGIGGAVAAVVLGAVLLRGRQARQGERARAETTAELAEGLAAFAGELRAGHPPAAAAAAAGRDAGAAARRALARVEATAWLGGDVPAALREQAVTDPLAGPAPAPAGRRVGARRPARHRARRPRGGGRRGPAGPRPVRGPARPPSSPGRAPPRPSSPALPGIGLVLGQLVGAHPFGVLTGSGVGQVLLVVGSALVAAGLEWSRRLTAGVLR